MGTDTMRPVLLAMAFTVFLSLPGAAAAVEQQPLFGQLEQEAAPAEEDPLRDLGHAALRLPLAAALGAVLAVRPRRRGTPPRDPAVIQTQIILAIVGAVVMLVVGTSLARAFGVVGAAGLVRYRSKIADPKDAGVMLSTLALGLASGVGLYALAGFSTVFILAALWLIESFEPQTLARFNLRITTPEQADAHRGEFERVLKRHRVPFELRTASNETVSYDVQVPIARGTAGITEDLLSLDPTGDTAVEWDEAAKKKA